MSDDLIVQEELEQATEEAEAQPEVEQEAAAPKTRYDDWDRDTAIKNYQEIEKFASRQGQEVGELRKAVDQLLKGEQQTSQTQNIDLDSLLEDPNTAIRKSLESDPTISGLKQSLDTIQKQSAVNEIKSKHPDAEEIWQDPAFQNYVHENPVRLRLAEEANDYNVESADYLFNEWKQHTSVSKQEAEKTARLEKAKSDMGKAASEGAGGGAAASKTFRRTDLARLKIRDPDKYNAMHDEILHAYQNGLVR